MIENAIEVSGVSIVIPNWNHEVFLGRSLRSAINAARVLREAGVPSEVLIVDDASRDGSQGLLRQLELATPGKACVSLYSPVMPVPRRRNTALVEARGRLVFFLDADNEVVPANLPILYCALWQTRATAVYGNLLIRKPGQLRASQVYSNECVLPRLFQNNYIDTMALADRAQLLDLGGFHDGLIHEDWELWQHLVAEGRVIVFVPIVVGFYYELRLSNLRMASDGAAVKAKSRRIFNQTSYRRHASANAYHRRYHPDIGDLSTLWAALATRTL